MGKKPQKKATPPKDVPKKLSAQKRNELDQLIDKLFKLGFKQTQAPAELWAEYLEIQGTLDRIQAIESTLKIKSAAPKTRTAAIDTFCKWCEENGAKFDGASISEFPGFEMGLEAAKPFKKGDPVITVPKQIIMSEEALAANLEPIVSEIPLLDTMTNVKLAFGVLLEKVRPDSFWKPYIDLLPERHSTVMYFTINDMQELKGSNVLGQALTQCKSIARQYAFIHKCVQKVDPKKFGPDSTGKETFETLKEKFTYELYRWAVSTVMTRQNAIPCTKPEVESVQTANLMPALIPLWDLANHKEGSFSSSYNLEEERLESCALSDYNKGEQIFIYYGDRSNADFLIHNGFVYPENTKDSVIIRLGLSTSDELLSQRTILLERLNIAKNFEFKILQTPDYISPQLLAFVRIFNMNLIQLNHWINSERAADLLHMDCALDTSLESKTWIFLQTRLSLLLKVFPTTLDEDEACLLNHTKGQTQLGHVKAMLVQYRILEKKILKNALDYAKQRTKP